MPAHSRTLAAPFAGPTSPTGCHVRGATRGPYIAVSDGFGHTCALTAAGEAVCWGWNNFGQAEVPEGRFTAISAGHVATCGITDAAEAVCWGEWAPELPPGSYVDISTGYYHACALTAQGEVVCGDSYGLTTEGPLAEIPPGPFHEVSHRLDPCLCSHGSGGPGVLGTWRDGSPPRPLPGGQRALLLHMCDCRHGRGCLLGMAGGRPPIGYLRGDQRRRGPRLRAHGDR